MIPRPCSLALILAAALIAVGRTPAQDALLVETNGQIFSPTNFFEANAAEIARIAPAGSNSVSRAGDTMSGDLFIVNHGGLGMFGLGSTNNPSQGIFFLRYNGDGLLEGGIGNAFSPEAGPTVAWFDIVDGNSTWYGTVTATAFTGAHTGDGAGITNLNATVAFGSGQVPDARIPSALTRDQELTDAVAGRVNRAGDTMSGDLFIVNHEGLGMLGLGSTNNPSQGIFFFRYNGDGLLEGGIGDAFTPEAGPSVPWFDIVDGNSTWYGTVTASSFTGAHAGNGVGITNLNASTAFGSGRVPIANLATGTPDGTKFIRDDGTLAVPPGGGGSGDVTASGDNAFSGSNSHSGPEKFTGLVTLGAGWTPFTNATRIVFEGDSLSPYIGNESQTNWSKYFTNFCSSLNLTVGTNAATSGQQISQMLTDYAAQVQPYKPSGGTNAILFFWAGINDVYYTNYTTAFTRLTNYWAGAKADGFTLVGFTITDSTNLTAQTRADLPVLNNLIRQHAPVYCDYFVDVAGLLNDVEDSTWSTAGVHYTSRANEMVAEYVRWVLLQGGWFHGRISGTRNYPDNRFRSLSLVSNSVPRSMVGGGVAFDADAWSSGHGSLLVHDGTTNTFVVAIRSGSAPSSGQVPVFQSDGTWSPQTPSSGSLSATNVPTSWGSWDPTRLYPGTNATDQATWTFIGAANPGLLFAGSVTNETYFSGIVPGTGNTNGPVSVTLAWRTPATETASNIVWRVSLRPLGGTNWVSGSVTSAVPSSTALTVTTSTASVAGHGFTAFTPFEGRIQMDGIASASRSNAVLHAVLPAFQ